MRPKIPSAITTITLSTPTFHNVVIQPAMINFFYGKNGTGKSTIARAIRDNVGTEWAPGTSADDYSVLLFNQEFIDSNIRSYGNLPGVFTISESNANVKQQIDAEQERLRRSEDQEREFSALKVEKEKELRKLNNAFRTKCWTVSKSFRECFPELMKSTGVWHSKDKLVELLLGIETPAECDLDALAKKYITAYDSTSEAYPLFNSVTDRTVPTCDLLAQPISTSSGTGFARFMKALAATDWVRQGHEKFPHTPDQKCPYCQQKLPDTFEADIALSFDAQYQDSIASLTEFREKYRYVTGEIRDVFLLNEADMMFMYPKPDFPGLSEYEALLSQFETKIKLNLSLISDKINEPSSPVMLESLDDMIARFNTLINQINHQILEHNAIVSEKQAAQAECAQDIWAHVAFLMGDGISEYKSKKQHLENEIKSAGFKVEAGHAAAEESRNAVRLLSLQYSSTQAAADSINQLLRSSGFQGFLIRPKADDPGAYEVVRDNNEPARNMSEGEKNFIAFLYFYHLVRSEGGMTNGGRRQIVVIDDPVSSMDSSVMFVVASLVREMVEACYNTASYRDQRMTGSYIAQIFIMTHNAFFHKEITYNQVHRYEWVTFFKVQKANGHSDCIPCIRDLGADKKGNYNPVQNSYAALWAEYREVMTPIPLMNVIHRILDYYFLQMCGYDGLDIRSRIFDVPENRDKFIVFGEKGQRDDYTKYHLASAMLQYLHTGSSHITDGLDFVDDCVDVGQCRETFEMIFDTLGQKQHFDMMMGKQ